MLNVLHSLLMSAAIRGFIGPYNGATITARNDQNRGDYTSKMKGLYSHVICTCLFLCFVADILIAMLSMSTELLWEAFGEWIFGNFACKFATYVQCLLFISTSSILMSMSWDRYEAICRPLSALSRSLTRSRNTIFGAWLLAVVLAVPQLFIFVQVISRFSESRNRLLGRFDTTNKYSNQLSPKSHRIRIIAYKDT